MTSGEIISAVFAGITGIIPTYFICKAKFTNDTKDDPNDAGFQDDPMGFMPRSEHDLCWANREATEARIEKQIETNRTETRQDLNKIEKSIIKLTDEARTGREKIYVLIEGLTKKVYKQGG